MNDRRFPAAIAGFAFVAAWIGFGFGGALLCLLGAAVFWLAAAVLDGKVDLGKLQSRLTEEDEIPVAKAPPAQAPRVQPRVQ